MKPESTMQLSVVQLEIHHYEIEESSNKVLKTKFYKKC